MKKPQIAYQGRWSLRHGDCKGISVDVRIVHLTDGKLVLEMHDGFDSMENPIWKKAHIGEFDYADIMSTITGLQHQLARHEECQTPTLNAL